MGLKFKVTCPEPTTPNPESRIIKVYIAVDSEGPTGVAEYPRHLAHDEAAVRRGRELMTADANAAVAGCFEAGATEDAVKDDGFLPENIIPELLDERARLLPGGGPLLCGLDSSYAGLMLIGFHAMEGAIDGVLAHTWSGGRRRRYWINDREAGELAVYAIVAGHDCNVPVIMTSGCAGLCREAHELLGPDVVAVAVKRVCEDGTIDLPAPEETAPLITAGARDALGRIGTVKPCGVSFPIEMRLQLSDKAITDGYIEWRRDNKPDWPGRRLSDTTIGATLETTKHLNL